MVVKSALYQPDIENLIRTIPGIVYRVDLRSPDGQIVFINEKVKVITGYPSDDFLSGKVRWLDLVLPEDIRLAKKAVEPAINNTNYQIEYRIRDRYGVVHWVLNEGHISVSEHGRVSSDGVILDITDAKKTEFQLSERDRLLNQTARIAKIGGWEINVETMRIRWSDEVYRIHEMEKQSDEPALSQILQHYLPDARALINRAIRDAVEQGVGWDLTLPIVTAKGNNKWVRDMGIPEITARKCLTIKGILQDVTESKTAALKIEEKELQLELALTGGSLGTWNWNLESGDVVFDKQWTALLGYPLEETPKDISGCLTMIHPEDLDYVRGLLDEHIKGETPLFEAEYRLRHKTGHWVWVHDRGRTIEYDPQGKATRLSGTYFDISERKKIELQNLQLQLELEEFKEAVSHSSIIAIADLKGTIKYANRKFNEISQYTNAELVGRNHNIVNSGFHPKSFWKEMWRTISSGKTWRAEVRNKRKDGTFYWVDTFIMPMRDSENRIHEYLSIRNDITEKKENEVKLQQALAKAEESDRLKSTFLANMSHEIRTPMNAILGFAELLERPNLSEEKRSKFLRLIRERSQDLVGIVNDILDISKLQSGQAGTIEVVGNVKDLLEQLCSTFQTETTLLRNKHLSLRIRNELSPQMTLILADFMKLHQVLTNLLSNACKFTQEGYVEIGCKLQDPHTLLFWVEDSGIGLDRHQQQVIFEPFRQATDSIHITYGGSGLGLAICRGLVQLWGGTIWVASEPGKGARFLFTMPYVPANDPKKIGARTDTWSASRLLIVEDDLINAQYVKEMLAPSRLQIFHAPNGTEAIRHLHEFRPDAMLLDLGLPDLSGYEVAKRAKAMHHDLPIVALTAYDDRETKLKCDEFGFNFFLTKPVSSSTLLATLRIVFQHASQ